MKQLIAMYNGVSESVTRNVLKKWPKFSKKSANIEPYFVTILA
jgi:hypothetical protein